MMIRFRLNMMSLLFVVLLFLQLQFQLLYCLLDADQHENQKGPSLSSSLSSLFSSSIHRYHNRYRVGPSDDKDVQRLPNILLIVTDQFRYDSLNPTITPNLYNLATGGRGKASSSAADSSPFLTTLFSNAYTSTPTCTPARAALLTGKSPWHHGMLGYADAVNCEDYPTTLPSLLADLLNYTTVVVGKNHFGIKPCNKTDTKTANRTFISHGYQHMTLYDGSTAIPDDYDVFFEEELPGVDPMSTCDMGWNDWRACPYGFEEYLHPTAWTTRRALQTIQNAAADNNDRPLFLKVSYHRPHSPYDPPKRLWDKHVANSEIYPELYTRNIGTDPSSWDRKYSSQPQQQMPPNAWHGNPGKDPALGSRIGHLANTEFVDEGIGSILAALRRQNGGGSMDETNTFVVWVSDHGDMNGDHNLWRKGYPWEASSHIHMLMKLPLAYASVPNRLAPTTPLLASHVVSDAIVELRDVAPTIYDLVGVLPTVREDLDPMVDGESLLSILLRKGDDTAKADDVRSHLDLEHSRIYDDTIHWNAIVGKAPPKDVASFLDNKTSDGGDSARAEDCSLYKYIFFAYSGTEQLFCLSRDARELYDLAPRPAFRDILEYWRGTMAKGFLEEGRGEEWVTVVNGDPKLMIRRKGRNFGTNYPCL